MKIWWCQEHNACWVPGDDESPSDPQDNCLYWYWTTDARHVETGYSPPLRDCRMVPMRLIPDNALETVWFCWLHKSAGIPGTYFCEMAGQVSFIDSMLMEGLDPCDPKHHQMVEVLVLKPALDGETP